MSEVMPILISKDDGKGNFVKSENARIEKVNQECANTLTCHEASFNVHHCNMVIVAMRGRNPDNPSDRTPGIATEQRLEPNSEGICNTLTTVQKDNLVLESKESIIYDDYNSNIPKNQDCIGTLTTNIGSSTIRTGIKIIEKEETVKIKQATSKGYIDCKVGGVADFSFPDSKLRRERVQGGGDICPTLMAGNSEIVKIEKNGFYEQAIKTAEENNAQEGDIIDAFNQRVLTDGISPTITTRPEGKKTAILPIVEKYRIRKLTPRECFRLMNVEEEQFNRAAFEKNIFYLEGEEDKCNAKLKVVQEKFRHIDLETYVLCTTNSILNMEELEIIKQKCKTKKKDEKTQNVNIVIEQLAKLELMECVTNTTKCTEFMGMRYFLIEKQDQHPHMDIIVQVEKDKENTEKYMKITTELNLLESKLYTILILLRQIIQSKIFGSTILKANIQGNIAITEGYENSILLKVSNLKMENISTRVSSSQLYKVAGNAIVVSCLVALFSQLGIQGKKKWNDMTEEERIALVHKNTVMEKKEENA